MEDSGAALLLGLDLLPALAHASGCSSLGVAKHVRVSAHELVVHCARNLLQSRTATLREEQRQEVDLEKEVAELVRELGVVALDRGVRDLVRLLDGVRHDRALCLLAVPRAFAAQPLGQLLEVFERLPDRRHFDDVDVALVTAMQGSGFGWYPGAYLILPGLQNFFLTSSTHLVIAWFFCCCSSCC